MPCLKLDGPRPGFICGFHPVYLFDGYLFEIHRYHGPMPLRKDLDLRKNVPKGFWAMWERFDALTDEEKAKYLYEEES